MSVSLSSIVRDDDSMSNANPSGPRSDGPKTRRAFTQEQKRNYLAAYEQAMETSDGGDYLRSQGLYYSQVAEWRRLRDAGMLKDSAGGAATGARASTRMSSEQAEIAKLRRELEVSERRLARTEVALEIMGKARELLEDLSKSSTEPPPHGKR